MKKAGFVLILLLFSIFSYLYLGRNKENDLPVSREVDLLNRIIVVENQTEKDKNVIKQYFAAGMATSDFKNALKFKSDFLSKTTSEYTNINYNFEYALKYSEIEKIINQLNYSDAVRVEIIGQSADKRNIYSLEIGFGEQIIMFESGIHAAEVANPMFIMKYLKDLVNDYEKGNQKVTELLNKIRIVCVPSVNPDGYEAALFGVKHIKNKNLYISDKSAEIDFNFYKANANGIDLNRNFPSQHGGLYYKKKKLSSSVSDKRSLGGYDYFPGETLGSELETRSLIYWQHKYLYKAYAYIALHSAGQVIYAGKPNLSEKYNDNCLLLAKIVSNLNDYEIIGPLGEGVGEGDDGTATDFASEIISDFSFSDKTGRLAADAYENPKINEIQAIGIITLETLPSYTFNMQTIKNEYYNKRLYWVFDELIASYSQIK